MSNCAVVGINWGDEGKGRMVDLLAGQYDVVIRYQGGSNAGHTVVNEYGKFALNLIPSGIFHKDAVNVLGCGVVIDPEHLCGEMAKLRDGGVEISPENFKISDRASLLFPFHRDLDALEEARLQDHKQGSTKRGIAPAYSDKYMRKGLQIGDVLYPDTYLDHLRTLLTWKNMTLENVYGAETYTEEELLHWTDKYVKPLIPYICNTTTFLAEAQKSGKSILFEAQLGALRDIDFGIYPFSSSSSPLASYAPIGSGAPFLKLDDVLGIVKAYSTCVGEGPFVVEWSGAEAEKLREVGCEYGAATGRPRRVGPMDIPATRYGVMMQGATAIALTKLDCLSYMDEIPICTHYKIDGNVTADFPFTPQLYAAEPVIEKMPGWKTDITAVRRYEDLPGQARDYIEFIEREIGCPIKYISVGAGRDDIIIR